MSALTGLYFTDGRIADPSDLHQMIDSLAHRGPEGYGAWTRGPVGLGHRMLWTTPESLTEKLPFENPESGLTITADARIDNRGELITALNIPQGLEISDSALILAAYEKWGGSCPEKLLGDFAFAIWDARNRMLYCARDHMGVKPFYYYYSERAFFFASEIKALLCLSEVPRRLNEVMVADYLASSFNDKSITFYQGIYRLPPGYGMTVEPEGLQLRAYWALDPSRELRLASDEEYAEAFRELFMEAVRARLRSVFPIGSHLSGGLDSSSVVGAARQVLTHEGGERLHTFSAVFDEFPECDERPFIDAVLAQGDLIPHYIHGDPLGPLDDLERIFRYQDEPIYAPSLYLYRELCSNAQDQNVRVLLSGLDGDITVSHGWGYLGELVRKGRFIALAREIRGLSRQFRQPMGRILLRHAVWPVMPPLLRQAYQMLRGKQRSGSRDVCINTAFARRIGWAERQKMFEGEAQKRLRTARDHHHDKLAHGVVPFVLEIVDRATAEFSIEHRCPFFDKRITEFCLSLPPDQKLHRGWTRMILRRAMAGLLPEEIRWRTEKADFSGPFERGLLLFHKQLVEKAVITDMERIQDYVDIPNVQGAYYRYAGGESTGNDEALMVWNAATLNLWLGHARLTA